MTLVQVQQKQSIDNDNINNQQESKLFTNETEPSAINNPHDDSFVLNANGINLNDDMSDSGYLNRNFEMNLEEIFDNLTYLLTTEK